MLDLSLGLLLVSVCVGLGVGILSGMLGIGGGTILVPTFKLGFALPALSATATSLFTIIPTSISGAISHLRNKTCIPRFGVAAGLGGALTSPVGVWLASLSPDWATMVAAACVIAYSACTMLSKAFALWRRTSGKGKGESRGGGDGEAIEYVVPSGARPVVVAALIGLVAGVLSGYVGVGGGFLMIPLFMQLLHTPMKLTSGTSLIGVLLLSIPGTVMQAVLGNVNWVVGICVALGAIPGAVIGTKLLKRVPELALRFMFGGFLLVAAALLVIDQLQ